MKSARWRSGADKGRRNENILMTIERDEDTKNDKRDALQRNPGKN